MQPSIVNGLQRNRMGAAGMKLESIERCWYEVSAHSNDIQICKRSNHTPFECVDKQCPLLSTQCHCNNLKAEIVVHGVVQDDMLFIRQV